MWRAALLCCILALACGPTSAGEDQVGGAAAGSDASRGSGLVPAPSGEGFCCPVEAPTCNCFGNGGWAPRDDRSACKHLCDLAPPAQSSIDEHGCEVLHGPNSCLDEPGR
jgi:hypothetical protein